VVTSIRHWIVLLCKRYLLAGVGGRGAAGKIVLLRSAAGKIFCGKTAPQAKITKKIKN